MNPLISFVLLRTSERDTWSLGHPILMAAYKSITAMFSLKTGGVHCPQKRPYSFSLQPFQVFT